MKDYFWILLISLLVGSGSAIAFFFASTETHQTVVNLPWWAGAVTGLVLAPAVAVLALWWHRKLAQEKPQRRMD